MPKFLIEALKIILTGLVAALGTGLAAYFVYLNQSRELDLKMVDVSLAILAGEKGGKESSADDSYVLSRTFALEALSKFSGIAIGDDEIKRWAVSGAIPHGAFGQSTDPICVAAPTGQGGTKPLCFYPFGDGPAPAPL